jgi:hypothetical protein
VTTSIYNQDVEHFHYFPKFLCAYISDAHTSVLYKIQKHVFQAQGPEFSPQY